jgi:hypothetical protein
MPRGVYVRTVDPWNKNKKRPAFSEDWKRNMSEGHLGLPGYWLEKTFSEEHKRKIGEASFCGGDIIYWHNFNWEKFGQPFCEIDGKSLEEEIQEIGQRLSMYCVSGDYTICKRSNWIITCLSCHVKYLDAGRLKEGRSNDYKTQTT